MGSAREGQAVPAASLANASEETLLHELRAAALAAITVAAQGGQGDANPHTADLEAYDLARIFCPGMNDRNNVARTIDSLVVTIGLTSGIPLRSGPRCSGQPGGLGCWRLGLKGRPASESRGSGAGGQLIGLLAGLGGGGVPGLARPTQAMLIARAWVCAGAPVPVPGSGRQLVRTAAWWRWRPGGAHAVREAVARLGGSGLRRRGARPGRAARRRPAVRGALGSGPAGHLVDGRSRAWWCALAAGPGRVDRAGRERVAPWPGVRGATGVPEAAVARPSTGGPGGGAARAAAGPEGAGAS